MPVFQVLPNYRATAFIGILLLSLISTIQNTAEALDNIGSQNNVVKSNLDLNEISNIDISTGKNISLLTGAGIINFAFGYRRDNYTSRRTFDFGGINTYKTNVDGNSGSLDVEAGTRRSIGKFTIEPSFGVRGDIISRDAFNA